MPNTVQFHRVLRATPERVYRAFLDSEAVVKWLPPNGFTGRVHHCIDEWAAHTKLVEAEIPE